MSRKTTVFITDKNDKILNFYQDTQAARINFFISAADLMKESPALSEKEWVAILSAANGLMPSYELGAEFVFKSLITGVMYLNEIEFGLNCKELGIKLMKMPFNQIFFIFELARKFWHEGSEVSKCENYKEWLLQNDAKVIQ